MAAASTAWVIEGLVHRSRPQLRAPHFLLAIYLALVIGSGLVASERTTAAENVLITLELAAIWTLTADFARSAEFRRAICYVIYAVAIVAAIEGAIGLTLFYLGQPSSLVNGNTVYFAPSHIYTRVAAGFYSPPLLGSFCVFASTVVALEENGLSRRARIVGQVILAALVISTISRPAIAFAVALAVREAHRRGTAHARHLASAFVVCGVTLLVLLTVAPLSLDPLRPAAVPAGINGRLADIESAPVTVAHDPFLGKGPGSLTATWHGQLRRPHFTPLNVAATTGLPSLIALAAFVVVLWRRRRRPTNVVLWSGLLGLGLDALTQDVDHFRHAWMFLGMADADRGTHSRQSEVPKDSDF